MPSIGPQRRPSRCSNRCRAVRRDEAVFVADAPGDRPVSAEAVSMNLTQWSICISSITNTACRAQGEFGDQYSFMSTSRETLELTPAIQPMNLECPREAI